MHEHSSSLLDSEHKRIARKRLVLVGQPNVGKSVLFNALTGSYVTVSNYPGTTVDVARGVGELGGESVEIVDSPGINSLAAQSEEERVTRSVLLSRPDCMIQVADEKNLSRALALAMQLSELKIPMVLCLNMKDEAQSRGFKVDTDALSRMLGIPVVETTATIREGIEDLKRAVSKAAVSSWKNDYPPEAARALLRIEALVPEDARFLCPLLLQNHLALGEIPSSYFGLFSELTPRFEEIRAKFIRPIHSVLAQSRQEQAALVAEQVLWRSSGAGSTALERFLDRLGHWCLKPWPGYLIAVLVLFGIYEFVGVFGAQVGVGFLEETVFGKVLNPLISSAARQWIPWKTAQDLLVGPYGTITMALTYAFALIFPIVGTFFLALGILEDAGYLPRLSVLLDRFFRLMGLNGKAVFPMILGLGCGTMAMLTTRILDTKKEKILVSFLLALAIPCSAQLGVVLGMASGLHFSVMGIWLGVLIASLLGTGALASRILPGAPAPFLLEIPPMRLPQMSNLFKKVGARLKWYLWEVVPLFIYSTAALYFLDRLGWLSAVENFLSPVVTGLLGLPEKASEAFLLGFFRRDYGAAGLYHLQREGLLSLRQSAVSLVAITLFMPCIAQWLVSLKERGLKATLGISVFVLGYALAVAGTLNRILLVWGWS